VRTLAMTPLDCVWAVPAPADREAVVASTLAPGSMEADADPLARTCSERSILMDVAPYQFAITTMRPAAILIAYSRAFESLDLASGMVKTSATDVFGGSGFGATISVSSKPDAD
jgi:hypothetical protein